MLLVDLVMTKWLEKKRLQVEPQRCVRTRNRFSTCTKCTDTCPVSAISLDDGLSVREDICTECMKCTVKCPSEALYDEKYPSYFIEMPNRELISFSCDHDRSSDSHIKLGCLSQLDNALLLYALNNSKQVTIQFSEEKCMQCSKYDGKLETTINRTIDSLNTMLKAKVDIYFNQDAREKMERSYTRRDLISFFTKKVTNNVVTPLVSEKDDVKNLRTSLEKGSMSTMYHRILVNNQRSLADDQCSQDLKTMQLAFTDTCNGCTACSRVCATEALKFIEDDDKIEARFNQMLCNGCESCIDICRRNGLSKILNKMPLRTFLEHQEQTIFSKVYKKCDKCGDNHINSSAYCEDCSDS